MAASPKEKFDAAIKVIHSLPKNGPFQPSHNMMLMFYGYFKQATEGPCRHTKPNFWEVVKKAKWDAWHKLGDMSAEEAMVRYVEELKKTVKTNTEKWNEMAKTNDPRIVETMPQTQTVGNFMETIGNFYELVDEESPIETAEVPSILPKGGSTGTTPELSHSETSEEQEREDDMDFSQRVEAQLQELNEDETDAIPVYPDSQPEDEHKVNGIPAKQGRSLLETADEQQATEGVAREKVGETVAMTATYDHVSSESEEEFCDSSDRPVEEEESDTPDQFSMVRVQMSTPLKPNIKQNHVRFNERLGVGEPAQNGRISPIADQSEAEYLHLPTGFPFTQHKVNGLITDSLVVQAPSDASMNVTLGSQLADNRMDSESNFSANNSSLMGIPPSGFASRGGEENNPPENVPESRGQGRVSSQVRGGSSSHRSGSGVTGQRSSGRRVLLTGGAGGGDEGRDSPDQGPSSHHDNLNEQIALVLVRLQQDMSGVLERLNQLEAQSRQATAQNEDRSGRGPRSSWWPFPSITGRSLFLVLVWPVVVHFILNMLFNRRRRRR